MIVLSFTIWVISYLYIYNYNIYIYTYNIILANTKEFLDDNIGDDEEEDTELDDGKNIIYLRLIYVFLVIKTTISFTI